MRGPAMGGKRPATGMGSGPLVLRIERLELEERDAVRRRDWSAARSIALERATLKEAHHRASARRSTKPGRDNGRRGKA